MIRQLLQRSWTSPVMMTWLNTLARLLSFAVVLPLVLRRFAPADISLYYLFWSIISLQLMIGSGFLPTFARFVSYALAGAREAEFAELRDGRSIALAGREPDPATLADLVATLRRVFLALSLGSMPIVAVVGTTLLQRPVAASASPNQAWAAWVVVLAVTPVTLYANQYSSLLQGANRIALDQRWSALFAIFGALSGFATLLLGGGLFALVASMQFWQIVGFFRLRWLSGKVLRELPGGPRAGAYSPAIFRAIWPASWKSFVGVAASNGIMSASGLLFAQWITGVPLAEFLFGVRIMGIVSEVSRAPFYTKLPIMNTHRVRGELPALAAAARAGMQRAHAGFLLLLFAAPLGAAFILPLIGSKIAFLAPRFWLLFGFATLIERTGAMHLQVYSTTNDIIWHWVNGFTGLIWIGLMLALFPLLGLYAYPAGMAISYACFYTWIATRKSLRSIHASWWQFERGCAIPAFALLGGGSAGLFYLFHLLTRS